MVARFVSDSSCDIYVREGVNYTTVPLIVSVTDKDFKDEPGTDKNAFLDALDAAHEASKSACPSLQAWINAFDNADVVYVVTLTSALSGTNNSARLAKEMYLEDHPNAKIHIFDSLATGPKMALIMDRLIEWDKQGLSFEEVVEKGEAYIKSTHLLFSLGSLHTMAMNGRVPKVVAGATSVLGIRVSAIASPKGEVEVCGKTRGTKKLVRFMVEKMIEMGYQGGNVRISYTDDDSIVNKIKESLLEKYPNANISTNETTILCSYYVERNGFVIGFEI
ncbi:MAG: DegV family protein [Bacillota bacterium]|nr:DegV family protein [Bacillota bacterium]